LAEIKQKAKVAVVLNNKIILYKRHLHAQHTIQQRVHKAVYAVTTVAEKVVKAEIENRSDGWRQCC